MFKSNLLLDVNLRAGKEGPVSVEWNRDGETVNFEVGRTYLPMTLVYNKRGKSVFHLRDRDLVLEEGSYFIADEGETFEYKNVKGGNSEQVFIFFKSNLIEAVSEGHGFIEEELTGKCENTIDPAGFYGKVFRNDPVFAGQLRCIGENIRFLSGQGLPSGEGFTEIMSSLLYSRQTVENEVERIKRVKKISRYEIYRKLNIAKEFIRMHFDDKISVEDIAERSGISKYYLIRLFKDVYNITPYNYILDLRINKAMDMLRSGKKSITQVCFDAGFESASTFSLFFKKYTGLSPRNFRYTHHL